MGGFLLKLSKTEREKIINVAAGLYQFNINDLTKVSPHVGGRNIVYKINNERILRLSTLSDRTLLDYQAEVEYVCYLAANKAPVATCLKSINGNLIEVIDGVVVSVFEIAKGDQIARHNYKYRKNVAIEEYFYNCGKTLGQIHSLSKKYQPTTSRFDFFDKYNEEYFDELIPDDFKCLGSITGRKIKKRFHEILNDLRKLEINENNYGMVHFDFYDGNYNIEYDSGKINVFDFDNCRTCWYMYDVANLYSNGFGWIGYSSDVEKRKRFMDHYMQIVIDGYRSQCDLSDEDFANLQLMVDAVLMENIVDCFESKKSAHKEFVFSEEENYCVKCLVDKLAYFGFYSDIYDVKHPFEIV